MSLELNGIITIDKLARYHEKIAAKYASTSDLENYATEEYVDEAIANIEHPLPEVNANHQYLTTNENGEKIWEDKLCYSYVETTEILAEQTLNQNGYLKKPAQHTVQAGQEYVVIYNGTTYNCLGGDLDGVPVLGNISLMREDSENTGEPFLLFGLMQNASGFGVFSQDGPHTFSAIGEQIKYKAIDGNYLAGGIFEGTGEHAHVFNGRAPKYASGTSSASFNDGDAPGYAAFAIGGGTASGMWSFAGGEGAHAKGRNSVAFGHLTVATAEDQLVTGSYNIEDTEKQHAFIIGNGNYQTKANIHTIDWQGNSKYAGDLYVNGTKEQDLADAKKVATEEYVTNAIAAIEIPEASANVNVYEITSDSAVLDELVALLPEGVEIHSGDVMLVTNTMGVKSAYQYDEDWIACDGNVDASKVIMPFDITLAGSYTQVGNLSKTSTGTATFATKGKSVAQAFQEMLSKREQPKIKSNPSVSLTATSGAKEVGTKITPEWSASLNAGSYTYGPATGITASSWEISDTDGNKASAASGKFAEITVGDTTNYRITAKANYEAGAIAVDNLGDPSNPTIQIAAGSKSANGSYITGYRAWFTYVGESLDTINSAFIRGTTNKGSTPATQNGVNIPAGTKRVMIAIPTTSSLALKQVIDVDGMGLDVFGNFTLQTVDVEGLNGYEAKSYNVWVAENTNGMAATHYNFIIE